jgi:hypothetical protein
MSAADHAAVAEAHADAAASHEAAYDPSATTTERRCSPTRGGQTCWTAVVNPTAEHLALAERERKMAADHRAASAALVAAQATACVGLSNDDRDLSPFTYTEGIASVAPLLDTGPNKAVEGAVVEFRALPGLTAELLQHIMDCHLAANAAVGHDMPEMPDCPLVPKGATARVRETGSGFAVEIRADDPAAAADILARAQRLSPPAAD